MNKLDKIKEVQKFIESNKDKDLTWYADNNGIVSRRTFFNWKKEGLLSASASASASANSTPTSELIQSLFDEHEKNENRKLKNRQYNYNTKNRKTLVEELQKENEELKSKYEELIQNTRIYYYELDDCALDELEIWFGKDADKRKEKLLK